MSRNNPSRVSTKRVPTVWRTKLPGREYSTKELQIARDSTCYTGNLQRHRASKEQRPQRLPCSLMIRWDANSKEILIQKNGAQAVNSTECHRDASSRRNVLWTPTWVHERDWVDQEYVMKRPCEQGSKVDKMQVSEAGQAIGQEISTLLNLIHRP